MKTGGHIRRILLLGLLPLLVLLLYLSGCAPQPSGGAPAGFDWTVIATMVIVFAVFYFLAIRPQRKRQQQQQKMREGLKKGDRVVTAGGIYGVIESTAQDSVVIRVESGALLRMARSSVAIKRE